MSLSRREFLSTIGLAGGAALTSSGAVAAPYQVTVTREGGKPDQASGASDRGAPVTIPATMPMGSGAALGGIGTGFVEIRADGCFYEWQIFNAGPWAQDVPSTTAPPPPGPQYLRFLLRAHKGSDAAPQVRRLYLRSDENDLYTLPFVHDVESIEYHAWFPMTTLVYNDTSLPVRASAQLFSPFVPGAARTSATPGFHVAFTIENTSAEAVEVSLAGFLDNPLASTLNERRLTNTLSSEAGTTSLRMDTAAKAKFPSGIGSLCFSVTGGEHSYIAGTFKEYALPGSCRWQTPRVNYMLISILQEFLASGRLPNTKGGTDPSLVVPAAENLAFLGDAEVTQWMERLSADALLARVFNDARAGGEDTVTMRRNLLKEVRPNLIAKDGTPAMDWGTGALASTVRLAPGQKTEIRFTLSWYFPHHLTEDGKELGHMYSNWFHDAGEVNRFLSDHYDEHRAATESFARTMTDTSCGDAMAFAWSSQLSTLVTNTWWASDGGYAIWEGLGCCGLSTTDVDYQGSFPVLALFPELKLSQMLRIIGHQNALGQVPHTFAGDLDKVDESGFARVDMNSQFVMMLWRDYLWTGDRDYLASMWANAQRAMAFTESLDTNGDALPDRDTGLQTYDQWRMRGTPSYIASLWIGSLRAAIEIATALDKTEDALHWTKLLEKASTNFDAMLFNGDYYSLWADGKARDELCMTDQVSGEWFTHLIGLPSTISQANLDRAIGSILKNNFNPEFGLHNATAPRGGLGLLTLTNLQAGGLWSGIEFAFASLLIDRGRYDDGTRIVEAIHRRYQRAGQPWNHVECGGRYSRALSSWATMLAASGFKPDMAQQTLTIAPGIAGDFHAPWVMASGFGTIRRSGDTLSIRCSRGELKLRRLRVPWAVASAQLEGKEGKVVEARVASGGEGTVLEFASPLTITAEQTLTISR